MPGSDKSTVKLTSYEQTGENSKITLKDPPSPEEGGKTISSVLNGERGVDDIPPPVPPKGQALLGLNTQVPPPSPSQIRDEPTHVPLSEVQGSLDGGLKESIYATVDFSNKTPKESLDSGIDDQSPGMKRSVSQETEFSDPWDREKSEKDVLEKFNNGLTPSLLESDDTDSKMDSDISLISPSKKTNRFLPRAKYAMQQKSFVIPATSSFLITAYLSSSCLYRLLYLKETINFIDYIKSFQVWPLIPISSGLAVIGLCAFIYNYRNTESLTVRNLDDLSNMVSNNNLVHDITIYKKNNDLVKFKNKSYAGHREIPNFTYKKLKLVKERALFNICLSSFITIGSIYPLIKYLELGSEGFIKFFSFSSGEKELVISKFLVSENDAKLLSHFNNHNLKLFAFAAVLTVLAVSLVCIFAYYRNEKTRIEPLKFDILVNDNIKERNDRYLEAVKGECKKMSTEIENVVVRHYNDAGEEKKEIASVYL